MGELHFSLIYAQCVQASQTKWFAEKSLFLKLLIFVYTV